TGFGEYGFDPGERGWFRLVDIAEEIFHHGVSTMGGRAQRPAEDGSEMLLRLRRLGALDRPVARGVWPGSDLVDRNLSTFLDQFDPKYPSPIHQFEHVAGDGFRSLVDGIRYARRHDGLAEDFRFVDVLTRCERPDFILAS